MDNEVSAGSTTSTLGHLALGLTLLAFGLGNTRVVHGVTVADSVSIATYVGGIGLFILGVLAFRDHDASTGTAFVGLGAFWFTWAAGAQTRVSANASGLFLVLFALLALSLAAGSAGGGLFRQGTYGLLFVALVVLAIGQFADSGFLAKAAGWVAAVAGAVAWYGATASLADWPTAMPRRAAGRGVTATG
ncbi:MULTISPECIES: GPR1/FUN34/YaaH family transporter [unclassified Streptomyces]|uniref:GPR1/FUN34/YaaH family transporter n=1 Tax=unclassified Streptomyces TaxID=2593676 RepID=UPI0038261379